MSCICTRFTFHGYNCLYHKSSFAYPKLLGATNLSGNRNLKVCECLQCSINLNVCKTEENIIWTIICIPF